MNHSFSYYTAGVRTLIRRCSTVIGLRPAVRFVTLGALFPAEAPLQLVSLDEDEETQKQQRKNQEEENQQTVSGRAVLIVPGGAAVYTAAVAHGLTEGRRPTSFTVAVFVTVTHPMAVAFVLHVAVVVQLVGAPTLVVQTNLVLSTLGAFVDHPRVRNVGAQAEVHSPAGGVSDGGLDDGGLDAKHHRFLDLFTLKLPTHGIPALTLLHAVAQEAAVPEAITFGINVFEASLGGSFRFGSEQGLALGVVVLAQAVVAISHAPFAQVSVLLKDVRLTHRRGAVTELRQITLICTAPAYCTAGKKPAVFAAHAVRTLSTNAEFTRFRLTALILLALLLRAAVTLLSHVHQLVAAEGGAVGLVRPRHIQQAAASCAQNQLLKVVCAAAAEITRAGCPGVHDAVGYVTFAVSAVVVVVHPQIMAELMSHNGRKQRYIFIGKRIDPAPVTPGAGRAHKRHSSCAAKSPFQDELSAVMATARHQILLSPLSEASENLAGAAVRTDQIHR